MPKSLTIKEDKFANLVVELGNQSEAYRQSYNASNMTTKTVNEKACAIAGKENVRARIEELKRLVTENFGITRDYIAKSYKDIVDIHSEIMQLAKKKKLSVSDKTKIYALSNSGLVRGSDAKSALDSLAKMCGFDNMEEKVVPVSKIQIEIVRSDEK